MQRDASCVWGFEDRCIVNVYSQRHFTFETTFSFSSFAPSTSLGAVLTLRLFRIGGAVAELRTRLPGAATEAWFLSKGFHLLSAFVDARILYAVHLAEVTRLAAICSSSLQRIVGTSAEAVRRPRGAAKDENN